MATCLDNGAGAPAEVKKPMVGVDPCHQRPTQLAPRAQFWPIQVAHPCLLSPVGAWCYFRCLGLSSLRANGGPVISFKIAYFMTCLSIFMYIVISWPPEAYFVNSKPVLSTVLLLSTGFIYLTIAPQYHFWHCYDSWHINMPEPTIHLMFCVLVLLLPNSETHAENWFASKPEGIW